MQGSQDGSEATHLIATAGLNTSAVIQYLQICPWLRYMSGNEIWA